MAAAYWLVTSDGGIFPFGDAPGLGGLGGIALGCPIVEIEAIGGDPVIPEQNPRLIAVVGAMAIFVCREIKVAKMRKVLHQNAFASRY
jgi:hypothetical protein